MNSHGDEKFRIKHHLQQHMAVHGMVQTSVRKKQRNNWEGKSNYLININKSDSGKGFKYWQVLQYYIIHFFGGAVGLKK